MAHVHTRQLKRIFIGIVILFSVLATACNTTVISPRPTQVQVAVPTAEQTEAATPSAADTPSVQSTPSTTGAGVQALPTATPRYYSVQEVEPSIRTAYLTLIDKLAVPVDNAKLAKASLTGLVDALRLKDQERDQALNVNFTEDKEANLRLLNQSFETLYQKYGTGKLPDTLMHAMLNSMAMAVGDEHTYFLTPEQAKQNELEQHGKDNFSGIGASVRLKDTSQPSKGGGLVIVEVFPGSPAQKAGVQPGDVVIKVDGRDITGKGLDAVQLIRGPKGTQVTLTVEREGAPQPIDITVTRGEIEQQIISSRVISNNIAYIRIYAFVVTPQYPLVNRVRDALKQMEQQNKIEGLILDLRANPGGDVEQMQLIASMFIPHQDNQRAVGVFHFGGGQEKPIPMTGPYWPHNYPVVVLVNEASGSGSEILAMGVKDYNAGYIIGQKTAGAVGSTTPITLVDGSQLWYTNSVIYSPVTHTTPNGKGITPDEVVPDPTVDQIIHNQDPQIDAAVKYIQSHPPKQQTRIATP